MNIPESGKRRRHIRYTRLMLAISDLLAVTGAMMLAIILRFEEFRVEYFTAHLLSMPLVLASYLVAFIAFRLYRYWWQYASIEILWSIVLANMAATVTSVFWQVHIDGVHMPRSITILTFLLATLLIGAQRLLMRVVASHVRPERRRWEDSPWNEEPKRVLILAEGHSAIEVLTALEKERNREVLGILDNDPLQHNNYVRSHKILGPLKQLHHFLRQHEVDEVIMAISEGPELREYVLACCRHKVAVRVAPVLAKLLDNPSAARGRLRMQDIRLEDLLKRPSAQVNIEEFGTYLSGKRVLITGAGGSIGSELCRQICRMQPETIILFGHGENSIFHIKQELKRTHPYLGNNAVTVIGDVRDTERLHAVFDAYRPHLVFHAAAHKHVPLMEENPTEAITNNVGGTRNVVRMATLYSVERMVLISTDKAVNPSSIMGASKFLCEELLRAETRRSDTDFLTVRFGNVLGSRGSVVPTFQEQIIHGGPVLVTHPEMRRFFMTIPEAVSLVLQAGSFERTGSLFVLDMGDQVRILDLAEDVIRLSGLEPYRDINIEFCGLRSGEKLGEELLSGSEMDTLERYGRLMVVKRPQYLSPTHLDTQINHLLDAARRSDDLQIRRLLIELVPSLAEYAPEEVLRKAA